MVENIEDGSFFCEACLVGKSIIEQSPDSRYCRGCHGFLLKEAEILPDNKHPKWVPKAQSKKDSIGKIGHQKPIQVSGDMVLNMSTLNGKKSEVDIIPPLVATRTVLRRGPKHRQLPEDLIRQLAGEGMGSKAIATRLKIEYGRKISYKTIQRVLSGERK